MKPCARVVAGVVLVCAILSMPAPARAQAIPGPRDPGAAARRRLIAHLRPAGGWNGQLVVYAPGYTPPQLPLDFYQLDDARRHLAAVCWCRASATRLRRRPTARTDSPFSTASTT